VEQLSTRTPGLRQNTRTYQKDLVGRKRCAKNWAGYSKDITVPNKHTTPEEPTRVYSSGNTTFPPAKNHLCANCGRLRGHKADTYRVRCTVGGSLIDFPGDTSTKAADLVTVRCLINNIISTPGARPACIDIKDFYLNNPLPHAEYIRLLADTIPQDIWTQYHLHEFVISRGYKGMYGLPQAGKVASDYLIPRLTAAGYKETGVTPGLFKHDTNSIIFALVVDDFLVQFSSQEDLDHLQATLQQT
jgi:hypothetical protein